MTCDFGFWIPDFRVTLPKFSKKETLPFTFSWFSRCVWKCSQWKSTIVPKRNSVIARPHLWVLLIAANFSRLFDFILMFHFILREIKSLIIEYCSGYSYKMKGKCIWHNYNFTSLACESVIHDVFKFSALNSFIHVKMYSWKQMKNKNPRVWKERVLIYLYRCVL